MIKKETFIVLISTAVGVGIITIFLFFVMWIGFPAENPKNSFKDALGFASNLFGGLATLGAAIIAAYLFNDWREQHNKQIINTFGLKVYEKYLKFEDALYSAHNTLSDLKVEIDKDRSTGSFYLGETALKKYQNHISPCLEKLDLISGNFNFFLEALRGYRIVADQEIYDEYIHLFVGKFITARKEYEGYCDLEEVLHIVSKAISNYELLQNEIYELAIIRILKELKVN